MSNHDHNNTDNRNLRGKRYICLARASDTSEGTTSTTAQVALLKAYGIDKEMIFVDAVVLDGVSGSLPGKREDLRGLLDRKREKDDFDVLIVQRLDRLTRGGSDHGFWIEHECSRAGIRLVFVGDDIPDGRYASLIKVCKYEAAQEQAFSISQRSTQGYQLALQDGRVITSSHTPYGCWRLYLSAEGQPSHIVRDCGDGRQQKLDARTHEVIDTYGQIGGGSKGHYRKQKAEKVLLMPGDADEIAIVHEIFDLHLRQGWGGKRIADTLNRRDMRSPQGRQWSQHQVEVIYDQEAYTGRSVGNRTSSAIYHERQSQSPKPINLDASLRATARRIPVRQRPIDEWFVQDQPLMTDFLGNAELRALAMAEHERLWQRRGDADRPKQSKSRHHASDYLLSGLLRAKQDGEPLVGVLCGRVGKKVRYYRHRRGRRGYIKGSVFNRMVLAEPIERAVVESLRSALNEREDLEKHLTAAVDELMRQQQNERGDQIDDLRARRDHLRRRAELIVAALDDETLTEAKAELERLRAERHELDDRIAAAESRARLRLEDPRKLVSIAMARLDTLAATVAEIPTFALRELMAALVESIVVDMETKAIEIRLVLPIGPSGVDASAPMDGANAMRPVGTSASSTSYETHRGVRVTLAIMECIELRPTGRPCYACRRRAA